MELIDVVAWVFTAVFVLECLSPVLALACLPELDTEEDTP